MRNLCLDLLRVFQFNLSFVWFASFFEAIDQIKISLMIHHADFYARFELLPRQHQISFPFSTLYIIFAQFNFVPVQFASCLAFIRQLGKWEPLQTPSLSFSLSSLLHVFCISSKALKIQQSQSPLLVLKLDLMMSTCNSSNERK